MRPDLIWMKNRSFGTSHELYDRVRGVENVLKSDTEDAEATESNGLTSFAQPCLQHRQQQSNQPQQ